MYNKKFISKGFTLIEIIVVMSIISIITSVVLIQFKNYKDLKNEIEVKRFNCEVISFINELRMQCIFKESFGQIYFLKGDNEIKAYESSRLKDRLKLPSGFVIKDNNVTTSDKLIHINSNGMITTPCSLKYLDRKGKSNVITIGVGTAYAEIKE